MLIGYVRVSTAEQNTARQEKMMNDLKVDKLYVDKASGKNTDRPALQEMMEFVREGDTVVVESLSRFGRSLHDLTVLMEMLNEKHVQFKSLKEGDFDTTSPQGKLIFSIMGALAEFERELILERQMEGIAIAKAEGKYKGRKPISYDREMLELYFHKWQNGEMSRQQIADALHMSRRTLYRALTNEGFLEGDSEPSSVGKVLRRKVSLTSSGGTPVK